MKSKIFISIALPEKIKRRLLKTVEKWQELPVKWARETNLSIILVFLGLVDNEIIPEICEKVGLATQKYSGFDLNLDEIKLFPDQDNSNLIVLSGEANEELKKIVNAIEKELGISKTEKKTFSPHVVLGRIRKYKWSELADKPALQEKFSVNLSINNVEIVASNLEGRKNKYATIEICQLN